MFNVREPTGAPPMTPDSNGATRRPVLYYSVLQWVHGLENATYKRRHVARDNAHWRAAHEIQQQWCDERWGAGVEYHFQEIS